jgi:hypothetical protein
MSRVGNYSQWLSVQKKNFIPRPVNLSPEIIDQLRKEKRFFRRFKLCFEMREYIDDRIAKNMIRDMSMDHHGTKEGVTKEEVAALKDSNAIELSELQQKASEQEAKMMNLLEEYKTLRK